jgi:hypothetical protein
MLYQLFWKSPVFLMGAMGWPNIYSQSLEKATLRQNQLDRLERSLRHLIEVVTDLAQRGIGFKSLQENLDTTTSSGKVVFHLFGALAEFEAQYTINRDKLIPTDKGNCPFMTS